MKIRTVFYCLARMLHKSGFAFPVAVLMWGNLALGGEIHDAAESGDLAKVKALIQADAASVFSRDGNDFTPLHYAAREDRADVASLLLANQAKVDAKDNDGMTPLHWAALYGCTNVAKVLLANKANVEAKDNKGMTALHHAAVIDEKGVGMTALLLAQKAQVNVKDKDGLTPLQTATMSGNDGVVRLLLANKAEINVNVAVAMGDLATVKKLLTENPALIFKKGYNDWTLLHEAAMHGQTNVAAWLLAKGAAVNAEDIMQMTPLHCAARHGYMNVVKLLLAYKADVNAGIGKNGTPLDEASRQYLFEMNIVNDPKFTDNADKESDLAWAKNCKAVIEFLLKYMAAGIVPTPGTNMIAAYTLDLSGKYPLENTVNIVSSNTPNARLVFTTAQPLTTNGLMFSMQISPGWSGHIQVSTNLTTWETLTSFSGTNSTINFCDPEATHFAQRFYRAVIP